MSAASAAALFAYGGAAALGPCAAPRALAMLALVAGPRRAAVLSCAVFAIGVIAAYAALGAISSLTFGALLTLPRAGYALIALGFAAAGLRELLRDEERCSQAHAAGLRGPLFVGLIGGCVVSPCCLGAAGAVSAAAASPLQVAMLMTCFAAGHTLLLLALAIPSAALRRMLASPKFRAPLQTASGTLFLVLSGYYGVLA